MYGQEFNEYYQKYLQHFDKTEHKRFIQYWLEEKREVFVNSYFGVKENLFQFWCRAANVNEGKEEDHPDGLKDVEGNPIQVPMKARWEVKAGDSLPNNAHAKFWRKGPINIWYHKNPKECE